MKILKTPIIHIILLFGALLPVTGGPAVAEMRTIIDRIQEADIPFDNAQIEAVTPLAVTTVIAREQYQGGAFRVLARKDAIGRFKCSVCHTKKKPPIRDAAQATHGDIVINHGRGENELACIECHDRNDRDFLVDAEGKQIDFDHSYQLCGQCHFRPKRDWLGGAHGKRVTYWTGERVVMNCTSCHNPHAPAFKTKMPETYSLPLDE